MLSMLNKMAAANRVSNLNLFAVEDKVDDSKKFEIEASMTDVKFEAAQDGKFKFSSYNFYDGAAYWSLDSRFSSLENDSTGSDNASAIAQLQADLASETVSRQSADTANSNSITAEISARTTAVQAVQDALDVQEAKQQSDKDATDAAISQEATDRQASVSAEQQRAEAAEAALGLRIDNVIGASQPENLDSLKELVDAYTAADSSLGNSIAAALVRIQALEDKLSELTQDA